MTARLSTKYPTRNRPEQFKTLVEKYISLSSGRHEIEFIVSTDQDDPTMSSQDMIHWLSRLVTPPHISIHCFCGYSRNKVEACNADLEHATGDILMMIADDMVPLAKDYDDIIVKRFTEEIPDGMGALKFWDGLRPKDDDLMCLQIIGMPIYRIMGHFFHPDYVSVFCDDELTAVCKQLGKFVRDDRCIIRHEWNREHFDYVRERTEDRAVKNKDGQTFIRRKKQGFDLPVLEPST